MLILATGFIVASIAAAGWYYYGRLESVPGGLLDDVNLADLERNTATAILPTTLKPDSERFLVDQMPVADMDDTAFGIRWACLDTADAFVRPRRRDRESNRAGGRRKQVG
jgi:hypothetical protein